MGRHTDYTIEKVAEICSLISEGMTLRAIAAVEGMPDKATIFRWLTAHKKFRDQYACAKEDQMLAMSEDIIELADDATVENVQLAKLQIDTRKWLMSKMAPRKFGDKVAIGGDRDMDPIETKEVGARDLAKAAAFVLAKGMKDNGSSD